MCTVCGDTGYLPAIQYGLGYGTGKDSIIWSDHAVMEPCKCVRWQWSPLPPYYPQPIIIPLRPEKAAMYG